MNQSNVTHFSSARSSALFLSVLSNSVTMHACTILCGVLYLSAVASLTAVKQDTGVTSATVGGNVTLKCFYDSQVAMHFSWYRQILGGRPELLSSVYKYDKSSKVSAWMEKNPRFSLVRMDGINHLHLSDVRFSDSATYFCGSSHSNVVEFGEGVFLSVKGTDLKEVTQRPVSGTIQSGDSVTLNCTVHTGSCHEEHNVYWFRQGSHKGVLHTHRDGCKQTSTAGSPSLSCLYHLQKLNLSSSDAGTYYCAVASCGEILFGNGSKLLVKGDAEDQTAQMRILVYLSIIRTGTLLLFVTICLFIYITMSRKKS
ncbi:uncharacterized protein LOC121504782 [Cheilinus undulatus]|uniref:uncharacterized protein LOC121504782 n=1 Tax=Cheilinus undulatus TaxID=241271 RepID=UPI001BD217E2|nr:uncharacterized protein LOC121504782 [Cheilinus undulatus]